MAKNTIRQYTLQDVITLRGDEQQDKGLYVFSNKASTSKPDAHYPSRSDFYTVLLITKGAIQVKLNLIDYTVEKDTLLFLFPNVTLQFLGFSEDLLFYGVAFTQDYLTRAEINKRYLNALDFLAANQSPQLLIKHSDTNILCSSLDVLYRRSYTDKSYPFRTEIMQHLFTALLYELAAIYQNNRTG